MPNSPPNSLNLQVTRKRPLKCGTVFSNHNYFPRRCKCRIGPARQCRKVLARQKIQRLGRRIRHYAAQITRVASSAIARSCESENPLPFLRWSSAAPAVVRCVSVRPSPPAHAPRLSDVVKSQRFHLPQKACVLGLDGGASANKRQPGGRPKAD